MPNVTEKLCAIERRAERAIVQELRLMTQEILAMRTQLTLSDRAHADALLLKLDHLERCQRVDTAAPAAVPQISVPSGLEFPALPIEMLDPLPPSGYLVHFYSHDIGDLARVELTETQAAAAQLVRTHLAEGTRPVVQLTLHPDGALSFMSDDDMVLASVRPCEPSMPDVDPTIVTACAALTQGDLSALRELFIAAPAALPERLAA